MLGVIAFSTTTIRDLVSADVLFVAGKISPTRTTDTYYIQLTDGNDNVTKIMAGDRTTDGATPVVKEIAAFLADPSQQSYSDWTMYFVGYLAIVPGLVGMLFLSMVLWDIATTRLPGKSPT